MADQNNKVDPTAAPAPWEEHLTRLINSCPESLVNIFRAGIQNPLRKGRKEVKISVEKLIKLRVPRTVAETAVREGLADMETALGVIRGAMEVRGVESNERGDSDAAE